MYVKLLVSLVLIVAVVGVPAGEKDAANLLEVITVDDIEKLMVLNPDLEYTPLQRNELVRGRILYSVGGRVSGDRLVANGSKSQQWATPQNVQLSIRYPQAGTAAVVSQLLVLVEQSSNLGSAYIIGGGIGQRWIAIAIEARSTMYFNYAIQVYGV